MKIPKQNSLLTGMMILFMLCSLRAQQAEMSRGPFSSTIYGSTGLFTIFTADTLKKGEFAVTVGYHNYDRDPGDIDVSVNPVSFTMGVLDRWELFAVANFNQSVDLDGKYLPPPTRPLGYDLPWRYRFNHDFPFMNRGFGNGFGDFLTGMKFNVLSEERGEPIGLAFRGFLKIPSARNPQALRRGRGTGELDGGMDVIVSKHFGPVGTHTNVGYTFVGNPGANDRMTLDLRDSLRLGFGLNAPNKGRFQGVFEVNNTTYVGQGTPIAGPINPVDLFGGVRFFPTDWLFVGGGYRHFINSTDTDPAQNTYSEDHHGFTVQVAYQKRKNAVPVVSCNVKSSQILQEDTTQLSAHGIDADYNSRLTYTWSTTGGRLEGDGPNIVFHAENITPGTYTVTVTAKDNRGDTGTCSKQITVLKRNKPPVVQIQPERTTVTQGESALLKAIASDPDQDPLRYEWTIEGEKVTANNQELTFGSTGRNPGDYTVLVTVSDGDATAQSRAVVTVKEPELANRPPVVRCELDRADLLSGDKTVVRAVVSDPENDPITLEWSASAGILEKAGDQIVFRAQGLAVGSYVITVRALDNHKGSAVHTCLIHVRERIQLQMDPLRVDNIAKGRLDDVALKMQSDPRIRAVITGYSDEFGSRAIAESSAQERAEAVKKYLTVSHHIDASRLTVKNGGTSKPIAPNTTLANRKKNRRVELELFIP